MNRSLYSVWDPHAKNYRYYLGAVPSEAPPRATNPLGMAPEDAAVRLPFGAKFMGTGDQALGTVAEHGMDWSGMGRWALYALAVYGLWKLVWKR